MKLILLLVTGVLFHFCSFSQRGEIDKYELDSLKIYVPENNSYTFYLEAGTQGLFFNQNKVVWLPVIEVRIINNTGKTIVNNYRESDGHMMWYREKWNDTIHPGEEMILVSKWFVGGMHKVQFSKAIHFDYTIDAVKYNFQLRTWGEFLVDLDEQKRMTKNKTNSEPQKDTTAIRMPEFVKTYDTIQIVKKKSYYRGEKVNTINRKGFKTGKWVTLYKGNKLKSQEFFSGIDIHWDSAYFYRETNGFIERKEYHVHLTDTAVQRQEFNDQGVLFKTYLWNGHEILEPELKIYFDSGEIMRVFYPYPNKHVLDYYSSGVLQKCSTYTNQGKVDTIKYYYQSGMLEKVEVFNSGKLEFRNLYDQDGDLLSHEDLYRRYIVSLKYILKTDSLFVVERYYDGKLSWTDRGVYQNHDLWKGIRVSSQGGIYSLPKVYVAGRENGFYYQDEWVNKRDSLRQQGKWLTLYDSGSIKELSMFTNGIQDSLLRYYESGSLQSIVYYDGIYSKTRREMTHFYEDGTVQFAQGGFGGDTVWVSYSNAGEMDKMKTSNGFEYDFENGNKCTYKITRPKTLNHAGRMDTDFFNAINERDRPVGFGPIEEYYKNCKLYKRITSRYHYVMGIEGKEARSDNYTIEKGSFLNDKLYNGIRENYDYKGKLTRSVNVQNGKEL